MTMITQHQLSSTLTQSEQLVIACVVIGALLASYTGFAALGTAISGTLPGAIAGLVIGRGLSRTLST